MPFPAKVKLCTESLQAPSQSPSMPPLLVGEALAFRSASSSIGNFSAPPEAPLPGELSSECETERLY